MWLTLDSSGAHLSYGNGSAARAAMASKVGHSRRHHHIELALAAARRPATAAAWCLQETVAAEKLKDECLLKN